MNAFYGYIQFNQTENYADKHKHFIDAVCSAFPSRFPEKRVIEKNNITLIGDFNSSYIADKSLFFSGEIYNKKEIATTLGIASVTSKTDIALVHELILEKGLQAIEIINGQFIIIYVDWEQQKIYFLNDHMGIKQFYYYHNKNIVLFGSEIKFLLAHPNCPKEIDWEISLKQPLPSKVLSSFRSYKTWFKDIHLLPGGSVIQVDVEKKKLITSTYWNHIEQTHYDYSNDNRTASNIMEEYISLLTDAIKIRSNNQGATYSLLSGGLDSSAITALCAKHGPLETFSIITQITYLESTTDICNNLANDLHLKNTQFLIPMHQIVFNTDLWKRWIWRIESPNNHNDSLTKTLLHYAIRKNYPQVKSVLTGTGSDQFNGGLVRWIANDSGTVEENWENFNNAIQEAENHKLVNAEDSVLWECRNFINREYLASIAHKEIEHNSWMFYVNSALYSEVFSLLWDEVRASNYHTHTTHFPFLDFRFVDFIAKVPPQLHKDLFFDKAILRKPLKNILPAYVLNKPKIPSYIAKYDYRPKLFNLLTHNMALVEEAFGNITQSHSVINKPALIKKIQLLQQKPDIHDSDIYEWTNIMRILNLGILEKMAGKNEKDMDIEALVEQPMKISFDNAEKTKLFLESRLSISSNEIDLQKPLIFCENCSLVFDKFNNKSFLSKNNALAFEIESEYIEWKRFLENIDNQQSTQQLLDYLCIPYHTIESFLKIAIEEEILAIA